MSSTVDDVCDVARRVKSGARRLARLDTETKDRALSAMAESIRDSSQAILEANALDCESSTRDQVFLDRLRLDSDRVEGMARAIETIASLEDPVGRVDQMWRRPNGLEVGKKRIPLGVVGIIYEARPNVTSDAAALCFKSGNGVILRGGSDAHRSNLAIVSAMRRGLSAVVSDEVVDALGFIDSIDRAAVQSLLEQDEYVDVIIPRGGRGLISFVTEHSKIPVIKHDEGVCHVVVEGSARPELVDDVVLNSKIQRPTVCNAAETLILTQNALEPHGARILTKLAQAGVYLYLCDRSRAVAREAGLDESKYEPAREEHYRQEFLSLELAVKAVAGIDDAIAHIDRYGSRHTEAILTDNYTVSRTFTEAVDSSCVVVNASTRFADGGQLGLGAEIGISTTRLHAYGPMGIDELTTTKFVVFGHGQIRI